MKVLREVNGYKLNQGNLMANGLFNISDENNNVSLWFDEEIAQGLLSMSDDEFCDECRIKIEYAEMYS